MRKVSRGDTIYNVYESSTKLFDALDDKTTTRKFKINIVTETK